MVKYLWVINMKVAVISFSFTGHVNKVVDIIKKEIKAFEMTFFPIEYMDRTSHLISLDYPALSLMALRNKYGKIKPLSFNSDNFDHVIFITPVWVGKLPPAMNTFFRDYEINCNYSVILSCFVEFDFILQNIQTKKLKGTGQLVENTIVYDSKPNLVESTLKSMEQSLVEKLTVYNNQTIHDDSLFS